MKHPNQVIFSRTFALFIAAAAAALPISAWAEVRSTKSPDACLAFDMPDAGTLFQSSKKVFAHYFYPFPLSIDNKAASDDYYNKQYLDRNGEKGKSAALGGYLRQRPLPVNTSANPHLINMQSEVRMAIARGITGFTVDVMSGKEAEENSHLKTLLAAADAVDKRFKIVVMPDISALKADSDAVVKIIASVAQSPAAYRLDDNRLVVSAFNAGLNPPSWWKTVLEQLKGMNIDIAFVPTFLGWTSRANDFQQISHGFSDWGTATAASSENMKKDARNARNNYNMKVYMMPVDPQQYRPKGSQYWEAGNSDTFRKAWMSAIDGEADWVQLVTWSDFSESSQVEPYTDATLRTDIGTGFYDLTGYYSTWFLTGKQPPITHDVLYFFYRREPTNAASPQQPTPNKLMGASAAQNDIEVVSFLTAPGLVKITIGGKGGSQNAPAGISSFKVPLAEGTPMFSLSRGGSEVFSFSGPIQIYGQGGIPSGVIDMTYWSGSASKSGVCTL